MNGASFKTIFSKPDPITHDRRQSIFVPVREKRKVYWSFWAARFFAAAIVLVPAFMLYQQITYLNGLHYENPHYRLDSCNSCHRGIESGIFDRFVCPNCHNMTTMKLIPTKKIESKPQIKMGQMPPLIELCTECHNRSGYMQAVHRDGNIFDVDITHTHPVNQRVTLKTYPREPLPLNDAKIINCNTCHDVHIQTRGIKMLRMTIVDDYGNRDPSKLCHNCHIDNGVL